MHHFRHLSLSLLILPKLPQYVPPSLETLVDLNARSMTNKHRRWIYKRGACLWDCYNWHVQLKSMDGTKKQIVINGGYFVVRVTRNDARQKWRSSFPRGGERQKCDQSFQRTSGVSWLRQLFSLKTHKTIDFGATTGTKTRQHILLPPNLDLETDRVT